MKIVVGMSGGVDSSITLLLLKKQGWEPIGVSLKLKRWESDKNPCKENVCCTQESFEIARKVCEKIGVPYHIYDVSTEFEKEVMDYFVDDLKKGKTPNPCIKCNRNLKFRYLFDWANRHGVEYVATGHYARIVDNNGVFELRYPKDMSKDQTYGLCLFPQEWLGKIKLPLGEYLKEEVYKIAEEEGLDFFRKTKQSQDLCFVSGKALKLFIEEKLGTREGEITDESGKVLGKHKGLHFYTLGQKKGLNLPGTFFVKRYDFPNNRLIVTPIREETTDKKEIIMEEFNFTIKPIEKETRVTAKIRYADSKPGEATLYPVFEGVLKIVFDEARHAVTPGQFCVFYKDDVCLGGGVISSAK